MDEGFTIPTKEVHTCLEQTRSFIRSLGGDRQDLQEVHATFADWVVELLSKIIDDIKSRVTIDREKLWRKFHSDRNAKISKLNRWNTLLN